MKKNFTVPVLFLAVSLVIISVFIITGVHIYKLKTDTSKEIEKEKENYIAKQKISVSEKVNLLIKSINFKREQIKKRLDKLIKDKVDRAVEIAEHSYKDNNDKLSEKLNKKLILSFLKDTRFENKNGYFAVVDLNTDKMLLHKLDKFQNSDMKNFTNIKGINLVDKRKEILKGKDSAFFDIYITNPATNKQQLKRVYVKKFKPYNWLIGTGEYYETIENESKKEILEVLANISDAEEKYTIIIELTPEKGEYKYQNMILNRNRPDLIGHKVPVDFKDELGNSFLLETLKKIKNGENGTFTQYWFKNPVTGKNERKITYFYLQKDWNWIVGSGFYFDSLDEAISEKKKELVSNTKKHITEGLLTAAFLSFVSIIIAYFMANKINSTINDYTIKIRDVNSELESLNKSLENKINEAVEHSRQQEQIISDQKKLADMGQMISAIAHHWRQPLNALGLTAQEFAISVERNNYDIDKIKKFDDTVMSILKNMSSTINNFGNFFKPDIEETEFEALNEISNTVKLIRTQFKTRSINIELQCNCGHKDVKQTDLTTNTEYDSKETTIYGYLSEFRQTILNLLYNAADSIEDTARGNELYGKILIQVISENEEIQISISDNGAGIRDADFDKIFNPYYTTKEEGKGSGLGLYMTKITIEKHLHGKITAANNENGGATFKIVIPRNTKSSA